MSDAKLVPCPFCGGEPYQHPDSQHMAQVVSCNSCGASGPDRLKRRDCQKTWNTRAAPPQAPALDSKRKRAIDALTDHESTAEEKDTALQVMKNTQE